MVIQSILPALFNLTLKPYYNLYCLWLQGNFCFNLLQFVPLSCLPVCLNDANKLTR